MQNCKKIVMVCWSVLDSRLCNDRHISNSNREEILKIAMSKQHRTVHWFRKGIFGKSLLTDTGLSWPLTAGRFLRDNSLALALSLREQTCYMLNLFQTFDWSKFISSVFFWIFILNVYDVIVKTSSKIIENQSLIIAENFDQSLLLSLL